MRVFEKPNLEHGWKCPICKTDKVSEVVLVGKDGTRDGNIIEAEQFHLKCLDLTFYKDKNIVAMAWREV